MDEPTDGEGDEAGAVVVDPVCGAPILASDPATVALRLHDRTWRFCGERCRTRFIGLAERARVGEAWRTGRLFAPRQRVRWGVA